MTPGFTLETTVRVPRDHPAFDGHFPGRPILPGVVLLAEALAALRAADVAAEWDVASAKFASPVEPGTQIAISHRGEASGRVRFEIRASGRLVASGVLEPRAARGAS